MRRQLLKIGVVVVLQAALLGLGISAQAQGSTLTLPTGLTTIESQAFAGNTSVDTIVIHDGVTGIGDGAFMDCESLTDINLPNGVTRIEAETFKGCVSLPSINLPSGITNIGESAFEHCESLTDLVIPGSVIGIADSAFLGCKNLHRITIPSSVVSMGSDVFAGCADDLLVDVQANSYAQTYCHDNGIRCTRDFAYQLDPASGTAAITGFSGAYTDVIVPSSVDGYPVTAIAAGAFTDWSSIVTIPAGVTQIDAMQAAMLIVTPGSYAESYCENQYLTYIHTGFKTYGDLVYEVTSSGTVNILSCKGTADRVTIPDTIDGYPVTSLWSTFPAHPYFQPSGTAPSAITLPAGIVAIRDGNVYSYNQTVYYVPVGSTAEQCCRDLGLKCAPIGSLSDDDFIYEVQDDGNASIVVYIGTATDLTIPGQLGGYDVTAIGDRAFEGHSSLERVVIPDSVASIGDGAFMYCGLSEISLPAGLTEITDQMLSGCNFSSFDIPYGITRIGTGAFGGCNLSGGVTIPDSVTYIGRNAFALSGFESISIPDSVTTIDGNPFVSNVELKSIHVSANNRNFSVADGVLYNDSEDRLICYPLGLTGSSYSIRPGTRIIGANAFEMAPITSVVIPDSVVILEEGAFGNTSLTGISIPGNVTTIGHGAFAGMGSLTSVVIPDSVTSIGVGLFEGDENLAGVTLPKNLTALPYGMFNRCTALTMVDIPDKVTRIDQFAFLDCSSLTGVTIPDSVIDIDDEAFVVTDWNTGGQVLNTAITFTVKQGSYAETWCRNHDLSHVYAP